VIEVPPNGCPNLLKTLRQITLPSSGGSGERTMKTILLAACLTLIAAEAQAVSRYDPTSMSCGKVQATIARQGAVILRYQSTRVPGLPLYDRYVQSQQFCTMGEVRTRAYVPSADTKSCPVYKCKRPDNERHFRRRFFHNN
jgi:methyl coenzyme M reductase subunit C